MDNEKTETILTEDLVMMLEKAKAAYGNRPVFVEINGKPYLINDLKLTATGQTFVLFKS